MDHKEVKSEMDSVSDRYPTLDLEFHGPEDGRPIKCSGCGSENIKSTVKDRMEYIVCEKQYYCADCDKIVGYWAYGWFDPEYFVHKTPTNGL